MHHNLPDCELYLSIAKLVSYPMLLYFCLLFSVLLGDSCKGTLKCLYDGKKKHAVRPGGFRIANESELVILPSNYTAGSPLSELDDGPDIFSCSRVYVLPYSILPDLETLPTTVDLRELGLQTRVRDQGLCGSCWAFGTTTLLETAILHQIDLLVDDVDRSPWFGDPELLVSEQYLMNASSVHSNAFCMGGNFIFAAHDIANRAVPTVELLRHYPYTSGRMSQNPERIIVRAPLVPEQSYLDPFWSAAVNKACRASLVQLYDSQEPFDRAAVDRVKAFVARGIAVAAAMNTRTAGEPGFTAFAGYRGGLVTQRCRHGGLDHQVAFVGYGRYKGAEAWVVRNSWGDAWGVYGYFYAPVGGDAMCLEHYAYAAVPRSIRLLLDPDLPAERARQTSAELYVENPRLRRPYAGLIVRGQNGLDNLDGTFAEHTGLSTEAIVLVAAGCCFGLALVLAAVLVPLCHLRRARQRATNGV